MAKENETLTDAQAALGLLKDVTPYIEKWASATPPDASKSQGVGTPDIRATDGYADMLELRSTLMQQSDASLSRMIGFQLAKGAQEGQGVPLSQWLSGDRAAMQKISQDPTLSKALDTAVGTALIRQDLEPLLYAAFVRRFPLWDRIRKEPSNGLVHAYNRTDAAPDASFITELGQVPSGNGVYTRATANVAIAAIKVGVSVKMQFAAAAGGGGWNPESEEIANGLTGLRRKLQRTLFSGNATVTGKVATDPEGAFDVNSFDGLRGIIPTANKVVHDPTTYSMTQDFNNTDSLLSVYGGMSSILVMDSRDRARWMNELEAAERIQLPQMSVVPGLPNITGVNLGNSGEVPVLGIPGNEIGNYTFGGDDVRDAYLIDESTVSIPYLGSDMPTILDIPVGVDGSLSHVFILFQMAGFAAKIPNYLAALRIPTP